MGVETGSGRLCGAKKDGGLVFRGIPYAQPPVGPLRFRAPEPVIPWSGVRDATEPAPAAPQHSSPLVSALGMAVDRTAEDCLYLNVWTPGLEGPARPVLVWVHGGSYATGSASLAAYDGGRMAFSGDVVVVAVQYRLGVLGSLDTSGVLGSDFSPDANCGLRDQTEALGWVQREIGRFGGDPQRVTVFGESSGAMSLAFLLATGASRGLFHRAILQSGAAHYSSPPDQASRIATTFLGELGISPGHASRLLETPTDALLEAQRRTTERLAGTLWGGPWQPSIDGEILRGKPLDAIARGQSAEVELVVGTNSDEMRFWGMSDPGARDMDEARLLRRVTRVLGLVAAEPADLAAEMVAGYRQAREGAGSDPAAIWFAIETDRLFRLPAIRLSEARQRGGAKTYSYLFSWPSPALEGWLGSCHTLEIPFVFGTYDLPGLRPWVGTGPETGQLSSQIQSAWLAFARDGEPVLPSGPAWDPYDAAHRTTMRLDRTLEPLPDPHGVERSCWKNLL
ncbi:MAG: carboxylesterase/lipase family protein [Myxococcota bacterium]